MNDRQRVEAIVFPVWFQTVMVCGVNDQTTEDFKTCFSYFQDAINEGLRGCDERKRMALLRRAARLHNDIMRDDIANDVSVEKIGLSALYALQIVLDADYLVLHEDSALASAIQSVIAGLEHAMARAKLDASARKHGRKLVEHMQRLGYFDGVVLQRDAA